MKKTLISLLCISLLTGCDVLFDDEQGETPAVILPTNNETPTDQTTPDNNQQGNENNGDNGQQQGTGDNQQTNVLKKKITFTDGSFVGQLDQASTRDGFVSYINGEDNLLSSVSLIGKSEIKSIEFGTLENGHSKKESHVMWWLGSAANNGVLTMNFNVDVININLSIQAYYKSYVDTWSQTEPFVVNNLDTGSKLYIDSTDYIKDLSCEEGSTPEIVDFSKQYETPTKQITIGNFESEARVYIHSMEITYKKNSV